MTTPKAFLDQIESQSKASIDRLSKAVSFQSVSGDPALRDEVIKMGHWLQDQFSQYGVETKIVSLGQQVIDGTSLDLPPVILGRIGEDPKKKTILVYGHYDVQPAAKADGWDTEPFELTLVDDKMYGRGSTDDKGPVLGWVNVLEAHHTLNMPLPVNMRFCFEGMEESDSTGLDDLIKKEAALGDEGYFGGVSAVCISDNYWLTTRKACLTYGLRGIAYFKMTVSGPGRDLHSGVFGGTVYEPMTDLIALMSKLVSNKGRILIPGAYDGVDEPSEAEIKMYDSLDYTEQDLIHAAEGDIAVSDDKVTLLMNRMRYPSLSLHGIEGASSDASSKTVIPARVTGKFSLRLVPPQDPEQIKQLVETYVQSEFDKLESKCKLGFEMTGGGLPWVADYNHWNYQAAKNATMAIYNTSPDLTREGGSIPVTLTFADALKVNVLLLPMGRADDGAHSTNEKLDVSNFIYGSQLLGSYLYEVASLNKE